MWEFNFKIELFFEFLEIKNEVKLIFVIIVVISILLLIGMFVLICINVCNVVKYRVDLEE